MKLGPRMAITAIASSNPGTASAVSNSQLNIRSTQPPRKPAIIPSRVPTTTDTAVTSRPIVSEMRAP